MKTETSHIEPGPVSKVDEWPDSCCFQPGSWERQPQCKSLRCHGGKASLAFHGLGGAYATPWSPWAGCSWYISQGWSFPCSQQVWWLHGQINKRSMPPPLFSFFFGGCVFLQHSLITWISQLGPHLERLTQLIAAFFQDHTEGYLHFVTSYNVPDVTTLSSIEFLQHLYAPFLTLPLFYCSVKLWGIDWVQCFKTLT